VKSPCHAHFRDREELIDLKCYLQPEHLADVLRKRGYPSLILESNHGLVTSFQTLGSPVGVFTDSSVDLDNVPVDDISEQFLTSEANLALTRGRLDALKTLCGRDGFNTKIPTCLESASVWNASNSTDEAATDSLRTLEATGDLLRSFITVLHSEAGDSSTSPSIVSTTCFPPVASADKLSDDVIATALATFARRRKRLIGTVATIRPATRASKAVNKLEQEACVQTRMYLSPRLWDLERQVAHFIAIHRSALRAFYDAIVRGVYEADTNEANSPNVVTVLGASRPEANGLYVYSGFRVEGSKAYTKVDPSGEMSSGDVDSNTVLECMRADVDSRDQELCKTTLAKQGVIFKARLPNSQSASQNAEFDEVWVIAAGFPRNEAVAAELVNALKHQIDRIEPPSPDITADERGALDARHLQTALMQVSQASFPETWYVLTNAAVERVIALRGKPRTNTTGLPLISEGWVPTQKQHGPYAPVLEFDPPGTEGVIAAQRIVTSYTEQTAARSASRSMLSSVTKRTGTGTGAKPIATQTSGASPNPAPVKSQVLDLANVLASGFGVGAGIHVPRAAVLTSASRIANSTSEVSSGHQNRRTALDYVHRWFETLQAQINESQRLLQSNATSESRMIVELFGNGKLDSTMPSSDDDSTGQRGSDLDMATAAAVQAELQLERDLQNAKDQLRELLSGSDVLPARSKVSGSVEATDAKISATLAMLGVGDDDDGDDVGGDDDDDKDGATQDGTKSSQQKDSQEPLAKNLLDELIARAIAADSIGTMNVMEYLDGMIVRAESAAAAAATAMSNSENLQQQQQQQQEQLKQGQASSKRDEL